MESSKRSPEQLNQLQPSRRSDHPPRSLRRTTSRPTLPDFIFPLPPPEPVAVTQAMHDQPADDAPPIQHFLHLLRQSKALIKVHGPYTTYAGTTVFSRAPMTRDATKEPSAKDLALSLTAAQDCINSAQVEGPAKEDLILFKELWDITLLTLDTILEAGNLDHETFGWGMFGLSAGYINQASWKDDTHFLSLKTRLHDALLKMPSIDAPHRKTSAITLGAGGKVEILAKANREIHVCANLLLQQFQREGWKKIRWYHGVAVVERWIGSLGLDMEPASEE